MGVPFALAFVGGAPFRDLRRSTGLVTFSKATTKSSALPFSLTRRALLFALPLIPYATHAEPQQDAYHIPVSKDGVVAPLSAYTGKVTLFVNVASYCALTPQYSSLVALHTKYQSQGFDIVASPCDQFGHQEPGGNSEICAFAREQFGAKFLLLDKLNVNEGAGGVSSLYQFLKNDSEEYRGQRVSWNFEKFLVGVDGRVLRRYRPGVQPEDIAPDVEWALAHKGRSLPPKKKKPSLGVA